MVENIFKNKQYLSQILVDQESSFWAKDRGVTRDALTKLSEAESSPFVVVISGLRRVGKSTLLAQLATKLGRPEYFYVNFEDERLMDFKAPDWDFLFQVLVELYGKRKIFLLDEIQNVRGWERFVRRMSDEGYKFYITGSNASLLSKELGTKLTGRYLTVEVFPFSFGEFLRFLKIDYPQKKLLTTENTAEVTSLLNMYLEKGGIPSMLRFPELETGKSLYDDVLYRDIANRYKIKEDQALKELAFYLMSNYSTQFSFNKLKSALGLGSVNTVKNFVQYLISGWLVFTINRFDYSVKKQQVLPKKVYVIDTGLANKVGFFFSKNTGKALENLVFLELRRRREDIYYYQTPSDREIDFYLPKKGELYQVCADLRNEKTKKREVDALVDAMEEFGIRQGTIITEGQRDEIVTKVGVINVVPVWDWLFI